MSYSPFAPYTTATDLVLAKPKSLPAPVKRRCGAAISKLCNGLVKDVPLGEMFDALKAENVIAIDEDGVEWSGFLCGKAEAGTEQAKSQRASISLVYSNERAAVGATLSGDAEVPVAYIMAREALQVSWCRIGEKMEVVAYIM